MLSSLLLAAAVAAAQPPVPPPPANPNPPALPAPPPFPFAEAPKAPAPYLLFVKANEQNQIVFAEATGTPKKIKQKVPERGPDGKVTEREIEVTIFEPGWKITPLEEPKLQIVSVSGQKVAYADAAGKVKAGALVLASEDGKPVDPVFLKLYRDDTLVFASPQLSPPLPPTGDPGPGGAVPLPPPPAPK